MSKETKCNLINCLTGHTCGRNIENAEEPKEKNYKYVGRESEYFREKDREPERKLKRTIRQRERANLPERKKQVIEAVKKYQANNITKIKAHRKVKVALKNGSLIKRPCVVCSSTDSLAHHPDYNQPVNVVWLCKTHHKEYHMAERYCSKIKDISISQVESKVKQETIAKVREMIEGMKLIPITGHMGNTHTELLQKEAYNKGLQDLSDKLKGI